MVPHMSLHLAVLVWYPFAIINLDSVFLSSVSRPSELSNPRVDLRTPTPELSVAVKSEDGLAVSLTLQVACTGRCSISVH